MRFDNDLAFRVAELERKSSNYIRPGRIAEVDTERARVKVQWAVQTDGDPAVSPWLPWVAVRAGTTLVWSAPSLGEQVLMLSPSGELEQAFVLPGIYQIPLVPPTDPNLHLVDAPDDNVIEIHAGTVRIRGAVEVTGRVAATEDVRAGTVSLRGHTHTSATAGTPTSTPIL